MDSSLDCTLLRRRGKVVAKLYPEDRGKEGELANYEKKENSAPSFGGQSRVLIGKDQKI